MYFHFYKGKKNELKTENTGEQKVASLEGTKENKPATEKVRSVVLGFSIVLLAKLMQERGETLVPQSMLIN